MPRVMHPGELFEMYEITDDSGFLAIVDLAGYRSFVATNWTLEQLFRHFKEASRSRSLVIWGTGCEDSWRVEVHFSASSESGFREFTAKVRASSGHLLLTNYESLTMAAQYAHVTLPERYQRDLLIPISSGVYQCRVVQRRDPEADDPEPADDAADFLIELTADKDGEEGYDEAPLIPWTEY